MEAMIKIQGLTKRFFDGNKPIVALDGVDITIGKGEIFGIIGLSGAGKSTLVRCINRLEKADGGTVTVDGQDIFALDEKELNVARRAMGMIFQQFNLLSRSTVLENICFPMCIAGFGKKQAKERAKELIALVGLEGREQAYPAQLSGGMKQRVAIARALALNPKVLLCDEATSALDPATTRSILSLLTKINRDLGVTIVIITHQMEVIEQVCNRVAILDSSRIVECGDVETIFKRPESAVAKQLVLGREKTTGTFNAGGKCVRIVFDGKNAFEPIIANLVLATKTAVNILFADTKNIDGVLYGQMVIQLPEEAGAAERILHWLRTTGVHFNEEAATSV